jgi:hypothetical protein
MQIIAHGIIRLWHSRKLRLAPVAAKAAQMQEHLACNAKCKMGETKEVGKDDIPVAVACWVAITAMGTRNARFMLIFSFLRKFNLRRGIPSFEHRVENNEGYPRNTRNYDLMP